MWALNLPALKVSQDARQRERGAVDKTPDDAIIAESNEAAIRDRRRRAIIGISVAVFVLLLVLFMTWKFLQRPVPSDQLENADTVGIESSTAPGSSAVATDSGLSTVPPSSATETGSVVSSDVPVGTESAPPPDTTTNYAANNGGSSTTALTPTKDQVKTNTAKSDTKKSSTTNTNNNTNNNTSNTNSGSSTTTTKKVTYPNTVVAAKPTSPDGSNGWYRKVRPTVRFTPSNRTTWYRWGQSGDWRVYKGPMLAPVGVHTLQYYSKKPNGVLQARASKRFSVDLTKPSVPQNVRMTGTSFKTASIAWNPCTDSYSGVSHYEVYSADNVLRGTSNSTNANVTGFAPGTSFTFLVRAVDRAGNKSAFSATVVAPPSTLAYTNPPNPNGANGWYKTKPAVLFDANESGVTFYAWDADPEYSIYSSAFMMPKEGVHSLRYYTRNNMGVSEIEQMTTLKLDTVPPFAPAAPSVEASGPTVMKLSWAQVEDYEPGSGVDKYIVYDFQNEGTYHTYDVHPSGSGDATFTISDPEGFTGRSFRIVAVDAAGNESPGDFRAASASSTSGSKRKVASTGRITSVRSSLIRPTFADPTPGLVSVPIATPPASPPGRRMIPGTCYDVTPGGPFSGNATIVLTYNSANIANYGSQIRMMHFVGGTWVDVTTEVDTTGHRVSGVTNSFSPFALFEDVPTTGTPAASWESLVALAGLGLLMAGWALRRRAVEVRA